ncbi:predicted protein [Histoplasma capsulatum G186AR]|uniref:Uncharacterized protein n=1 Tax=Ajellomyces capsulatus (strain G186AR / H82 / ATCC MYA-2454 / RMSCC 2432) TaxID=447093 RepID=C0NM46_AJECG|nr:uncharacterized protein HCBG_04576 [Histoplasma capsulatum G186AR]EEH07697.1 predicted protein [Histoplasma capsulatum G186AR]
MNRGENVFLLWLCLCLLSVYSSASADAVKGKALVDTLHNTTLHTFGQSRNMNSLGHMSEYRPPGSLPCLKLPFISRTKSTRTSRFENMYDLLRTLYRVERVVNESASLISKEKFVAPTNDMRQIYRFQDLYDAKDDEKRTKSVACETNIFL